MITNDGIDNMFQLELKIDYTIFYIERGAKYNVMLEFQ